MSKMLGAGTIDEAGELCVLAVSNYSLLLLPHSQRLSCC